MTRPGDPTWTSPRRGCWTAGGGVLLDPHGRRGCWTRRGGAVSAREDGGRRQNHGDRAAARAPTRREVLPGAPIFPARLPAPLLALGDLGPGPRSRYRPWPPAPICCSGRGPGSERSS